MYPFNTKQWFLTQNEVLKWYENLQSQLLRVMKSTKCTISRIYFFNKVLWDFPGLNKKNSRVFPGVSRDFQGFTYFPGFSRISSKCIRSKRERSSNLSSTITDCLPALLELTWVIVVLICSCTGARSFWTAERQQITSFEKTFSLNDRQN